MRKLLLLAVSLLLTVTTIFAERVSESDAVLVAKNFMNVSAPTQSGVKKTAAKKMLLKNAASVEQNRYYVYEYPEGGWVMVAANDVARPIIAYSETGTFKTDNQPANVKAWLSAIDKKIIFAEQNNIEATEEVSQEWLNLKNGISPKNATVVVAPLITTTWDQDDPYWALCPSKGSSKTYVGCVATAMAQVMNFWKWPKQGTGSYSYTTEQNSLSCSADFANTSYDWDNMVDHYTPYYNGGSNTISVSTPTDAQKKAVATLMYHCGVAVQMEYGTASQGGSGAQTIYPNATSSDERCAQNALWKHFGYKKTALKGYYRPGGYGYSKVNDATWLNLLKTELDAKRPIMYAGGDSEGGHSFVCDGYNSDNYFHFNWGWSGYCDGYYSVDNMVPGVGGSGAGNGSYNDDQDIIIGIIPDKPDINITWSVEGAETTEKYAYGDKLTPSTTPSNCANGKVFVGWTAQSAISHGSKPSDFFTSGSKTVTEEKTYYAVFATMESGSSTPSEVATVTFNTNSSDGSTDISESIASKVVDSSNGIASFSGTKVYEGKSGAKIGTGSYAGSIVLTLSSEVAVTKVIVDGVKYGSDAGKLRVTAGSTILGDEQTPASNLEFEASTPVTTNQITVATTSNRAYISSISVIAGGGASYKDYSLNCGTVEPCVLTAISLNTDNVKKTFAVGETFNSTGLVVTAAYSNCSDKTVTPTSVTTPDLTAAGNKTVTVSYTENNVTQTATYQISVTEPVKYNVTWSVNGVPGTPVQYTEGEALILPTTPSDCSETQVFVGWTANNSISDGAKPVDLFTEAGSKKVNADITYYAVFATKTAGSGSAVSDTLTNALIGVSGTNYTAWTGKTANSSAVYAGQSAGGNNAIQLRSNNNNSGIVTTTSGGKATKIEVAWNSNTSAGRTTNIYGSNSAYESADDLYNSSKQGTLLGTCVVGTSTELTIDDEYEYIGIRSASGALYLDKVIITWGSGSATTYSNYTLSCQEVVVCALTGITLNTESVQTTFTVGDDFNSTGLVVTATYSNCDNKTVSTATVTKPDMTTAGTKQVTVTYTENEVTKTASYNITVNELPVVNTYTVTWHACDGNKVVTYKEGDPLVLPATPAANAGKAFYGWITDEHYTGATAPAIISAGGAVNTDADYYAVYK